MASECRVAECDRPAKVRGWCHAHYMRWYTTGEDPRGPVGPAPRKTLPPCAVEGCTRLARSELYCDPHYRRVLRNGDPGPADIQPKAGNGKGKGRWVANGYVWVRADHPNAYSNGTMLEHRLVMSQMVGRPLKPYENPHHRNGDKTDNRPENLELWSTSQPKGQRVADKLAWAREIIDLYGDLPGEVIA